MATILSDVPPALATDFPKLSDDRSSGVSRAASAPAPSRSASAPRPAAPARVELSSYGVPLTAPVSVSEAVSSGLRAQHFPALGTEV